MANWKYDISIHGAALHDAINDADENYAGSKAVLDKMIECLEHIKSIIPEDDFEIYFDDLLEDARLFAENEPEDYLDEQDAVENVDYLLSNFYDACDGYRIWIGT